MLLSHYSFFLLSLQALAGNALANSTDSYMDLNPIAGKTVLYEVQVRTANACDPTTGSETQKARCKTKLSPKVTYRAEHMSCAPDTTEDFNRIKLGTFEDLMAETADFRSGITLKYIHDKVGANMVWLMPIFPNNDQWKIPDACDNLGSPYAVRDYLHVSGMISQTCIKKGADEHDETPCWGGDSFDRFIAKAHAKGIRVMLDLAFNHFGHKYNMYDYAQYTPVRDRIAKGEDLNKLWDFNATYEANLLRPEILDTPEKLAKLASTSPYHKANLAALTAKCPDLKGHALVRNYHMWLNALDWERAKFSCSDIALEYKVPGFYLGRNSYDPSSGDIDPSTDKGDTFTNNWQDVKFLFHHEENFMHQHEFVRNREYLFRIVNYWVSRGVDGFRFDHSTDPNGGMGPNEWKYILSKVDFYANRRHQAKLIFLAEEFEDQQGMSHVVDVMTDGYVHNITGRDGKIKNASYVEGVVSNNDRFNGHTYVMTALETHDENRLVWDAGFNMKTGAGFWGIGATTWSTPMILMGQEFGDNSRVGFRRSSYLPGRFNPSPEADSLVDLYGAMIRGRLDKSNRALQSWDHYFLRPKYSPNSPDERIFAEAKWSKDGNVVFAFHNLWMENVNQTYSIRYDKASEMMINDSMQYRLVDILTGKQQGGCHSGSDLKNNFYVAMDTNTIAQWLRLELCQ